MGPYSGVPKDPKSVLQIQTRSSSQFHRCLRHHTSLANSTKVTLITLSWEFHLQTGLRAKTAGSLRAGHFRTLDRWGCNMGEIRGNDVSPGEPSPSGTTSSQMVSTCKIKKSESETAKFTSTVIKYLMWKQFKQWEFSKLDMLGKSWKHIANDVHFTTSSSILYIYTPCHICDLCAIMKTWGCPSEATTVHRCLWWSSRITSDSQGDQPPGSQGHSWHPDHCRGGPLPPRKGRRRVAGQHHLAGNSSSFAAEQFCPRSPCKLCEDGVLVLVHIAIPGAKQVARKWETTH